MMLSIFSGVCHSNPFFGEMLVPTFAYILIEPAHPPLWAFERSYLTEREEQGLWSQSPEGSDKHPLPAHGVTHFSVKWGQ